MGFIARRLLSAAITLVILSAAVFWVAAVLPGSIGRAILGREAKPEAVAQLNRELGADGPVLQRFVRWFWAAIGGDFGQSYKYRPQGVMDFLPEALAASLKLAVLTLCIVVPVSIVSGLIAALKQGRWPDRLLTLTGLTLAVTPEFVFGLALILIFAVHLGWLPSGGSPDGSVVDQLKVMILPALTLSAILFGYLARMVRAGAIEALQADYTRTATLKGLPRRTVLRKHVMRNALLPTIAVITSQTSYLLGGLLVTERMFSYRGLGLLIFDAATDRDVPMLLGGVFVVGALAMLMTLVGDVLTAWLNPRVRLGGGA